jgi:hypothetical protein
MTITGGQPTAEDDQQATSEKQTAAEGHSLASTSSTKFPLQRLFVLALLIVPILYGLTLARTLVLGDPTEYTFVANILGIAHPPGYAFYTLLGKLFQTLVPFGEIPWRMHLLSATIATAAILFVYGTVLTICRQSPVKVTTKGIAQIAAIFAALLVATATDWWQHAIHANPHIVTATFLAANLFLLTKWWAGDKASGNQSSKWLLVFSFSAGLGITHHPLTVFSFLAYGLFILLVRSNIWREWRTLVKMLASFLLGLLVWLYLPLRSAMEPVFGPNNLNTLNGFLDHVLARGISEGLPFFTLADQLDRATVFWSLLRLQYALPVIFLALVALIWLAWDPAHHPSVERSEVARSYGAPLRPLAFLFGLSFLANYLFVINLQAQDVMAYLLGIFLLVGLLAGIGLWALIDLLARRIKFDKKALALLLGALFLLGPILQMVRNTNRISLAGYQEGSEYVESVFELFSGQAEDAILLNDWEHMTPLWYERYVQSRWPDPEQVTPVLVATERPWLESVFYYLPSYPVYLSGYRSEIVGAGFRLRPRGELYQVVQPGDSSIPPELTEIDPVSAAGIEILAYQLPQEIVNAGDFIPLTMAMRTQENTEDFLVPIVYLGEGDNRIRYEFTTDNHLTTPLWQPGEVIIERFDFALPHDIPTGTYPLFVELRNLSSMEDIGLKLKLSDLEVQGQKRPVNTKGLLANYRQQVGLAGAKVREGLFNRRSAPWEEPIQAKPGDTIHLSLDWLSLAPADESYTVFVHLIDGANRPLAALDYTPLGGSTPTHLWIPKWLPGQQMKDPYRLELPEDIQPGRYFIEVGLYEMTGKRRLHISDGEGNLIGDRYILGAIEIQE